MLKQFSFDLTVIWFLVAWTSHHQRAFTQLLKYCCRAARQEPVILELTANRLLMAQLYDCRPRVKQVCPVSRLAQSKAMYAAVSLDNNKMRVNILQLHDDTRWKLFNTFVSHPSWPQKMAPVLCGKYCSLMQHGLLCACVAKLTIDWKKFKKWNRKSYFCKNNLDISNYFSGSFSLTLYKTCSIKIYCKIYKYISSCVNADSLPKA